MLINTPKIDKYFTNISLVELEKIYDDKIKKGILKNNNKKLGKLIWDFSLPPIVSCPNCEDCKLDCYAVSTYKMYKSAKLSWDNNFKLCLNNLDLFKDCVINQLSKGKILMVRIHQSGDFYSDEYLQSWIDIINLFPNIKFFAYTKSFEGKNFTPPENLNIIDSFIEYEGYKYLNFSNYDVISKLRNKTKSIICPNTKGGYLKNIHKKDKQSKQYIKGDKLKKMTCSDCLYCIDKKNVLFVQH